MSLRRSRLNIKPNIKVASKTVNKSSANSCSQLHTSPHKNTKCLPISTSPSSSKISANEYAAINQSATNTKDKITLTSKSPLHEHRRSASNDITTTKPVSEVCDTSDRVPLDTRKSHIDISPAIISCSPGSRNINDESAIENTSALNVSSDEANRNATEQNQDKQPINGLCDTQEVNSPFKSSHSSAIIERFSEPVASTLDIESTKESQLKIDPPKAKRVRRELPVVPLPRDQPPDKFKMRMIDLIHWNPSSNPMKPKTKSSDGSAKKPHLNLDDLPSDSCDSFVSPAPQIKIGPDGNIIINEASLMVETVQTTVDEATLGEAVTEDAESDISYYSFRKNHRPKPWSKEETERFYQALQTVGTDFSLMTRIFPHRPRQDLKIKFKKEDRQNSAVVEAALANRRKFDMSIFDHPFVPQPKSKKNRNNNERRRSRKCTNYYDDTSTLTNAKDRINHLIRAASVVEGESKSPSVSPGMNEDVFGNFNNSFNNVTSVSNKKRRTSKHQLPESDRTSHSSHDPGESDILLLSSSNEDLISESADHEQTINADPDIENSYINANRVTRSGRLSKPVRRFDVDVHSEFNERNRRKNLHNSRVRSLLEMISADKDPPNNSKGDTDIISLETSGESDIRTRRDSITLLPELVPPVTTQPLDINTLQTMDLSPGQQIILVRQNHPQPGKDALVHVYVMSPTPRSTPRQIRHSPSSDSTSRKNDRIDDACQNSSSRPRQPTREVTHPPSDDLHPDTPHRPSEAPNLHPHTSRRPYEAPTREPTNTDRVMTESAREPNICMNLFSTLDGSVEPNS